MTRTESRFEELKRYIRFTSADEEAIRALAPTVVPHTARIIEEFYERIKEHEGARRVITDGDAQIERLKRTLREWLDTLLSGPFDEAYYDLRTRIGRRHVKIGLSPRYMILAMDLIRWEVQELVFAAHAPDVERIRRTARAVAKICDIELAIMLETYGEEFALLLKRRERLATIGQLGASVSHEVKNPLGVIASSAYALRQRCPEGTTDPAVRRHIEKIERAADQAARIITALLDFARTKEPQRIERSVNEIVSEAAGSVRLAPGTALDLALDPALPFAEVDALMVGRLVANLVQNAAEALLGGGGRIHVATARAGADHVEVAVTDDGPGIAGDVLGSLFEPLVTSKVVGTGLGLALCRGIAEAHGGTISARNVPAGGAEFRVRLPIRKPAAEAPAASAGESD
jgi:signal transduction histidine kinase